MGHLQSKEDCFYLSPDLHQALDDKLSKQKTGFNLANYNMDESLSELSICLEEKMESSPLRVQLPPRRSETETSKLLTLDHEDAGNHDNEGSHANSKINIEEFECGVHFECSENAKQEWAFTLYDFDGHGKIPKEDLGSLLKALYDAVGSSIKLPPNGAKTLKLRLSVGQETVSHLQNPDIKSAEHGKTSNKTPRHQEREFSKLNNLTRGHVKRTNESKGQRVVNQETTTATNQATASTMNQATMNQTTMNQAGKDVSSQPEEMSHHPGTEHQGSVDIVQDNLAGNQGRPSRKHQNETRNLVRNRHKRPHRASGLHCPTTSADAVGEITAPCGTRQLFAETTVASAPKESQDRRNYYLDLAGVECNAPKVLNNLCLPSSVSSCRRTSGKNKHRLDCVSFGATNGMVPCQEKCDMSSLETSAVSFIFPQVNCGIPSCLMQEKGDISSPLNQERCGLNCGAPCSLLQEKCISSRLTHGKCDVSSRLTHDKGDICRCLDRKKLGIYSRLTQEKGDTSSPLNQEKCGISSRFTKEKGDISFPINQEKCGISSRLTQEMGDITSHINKEKCGISSHLTQEKGNVTFPMNQEKCGMTAHLIQEKSDVLSPLRREKCDVFTHLPREKCSISSRFALGKCGISLSTQPEKCDMSFQLREEKCDTTSCMLQEKGDISSGRMRGKCDVSSRLAQEKFDISSRPRNEKGDIYSHPLQEKDDISSRLTQEKGDIFTSLPQEKRDEAPRLRPAKCDTSSHLLRDKCNVDSRTTVKPTPSRPFQTLNDNPSRPPLGKCDNMVRQEGGASKKPQGFPSNLHLRSKSLDVPEIPKSKKSAKSKKPKGWLNFNGGRFHPANLPGQESITVLPDCHRRQRHREKERGVMMQQVAEWIEREHVDSVVVQRHEHHHVHEHHHHHHFHHHHET